MSWLFGSKDKDKEKTKVVAQSDLAEEYKGEPISTEEFDKFIATCDEEEGWSVAYEDKKKRLTVYTKKNDISPINMVKARKIFTEFEPEVLYDVLHDHEYRTTWDDAMIEGYMIKEIDHHNAVGYYAAKFPPPLTNRDFVNHRGWQARRNANPPLWVICNHSVHYPGFGEKSGYVRAWSYRTGYLIRKLPTGETQFTYCTLAVPKGWIPAWVMNMAVSTLGPRVITKLEEVAPAYPEWFKKNRPDGKRPWITPPSSPRSEKEDEKSEKKESETKKEKKEKH